jgi:hypothetical protein
VLLPLLPLLLLSISMNSRFRPVVATPERVVMMNANASPPMKFPVELPEGQETLPVDGVPPAATGWGVPPDGRSVMSVHTWSVVWSMEKTPAPF